MVERGPHHNLVEVIGVLREASGQVRAVTNRYTQLETGLNYRDARGAWQSSTARIELAGGQATFRQGQFQAVFAANIADPIAVELWTPDDQVLKSRILGLAWYDPESGQSVLLAELKDSTGQLLPTGDALLYSDCLTDILGDVRLTVTKAGFEQDLILREQPPGPEIFGLGPRSELQLLTEFFDPPVPREHTGERAVTEGTNQVATLTAPRVDPRLTFGSMSLGKGRAFRVDDHTQAVPVRKTWERLEGRQFLIESVDHEALRSQLDSLPKPVGVRSAQAAPSLRDHLRTTARKRAVASNPPSEIRVAQVFPARPGVVLDYFATLSSASNFTLKSDTTYYVTGPVILTGVTTIEGGTVVKFANSNNPHLKLQGTVRCQTGPCRPAFFTARDDNTVGAVISGSTGIPSGTYATTTLWLDDNVASLQHLRIAWAGQAVYYDADTGWPQELWHVQVSHCDYGVVALCPEFRVYNALMDHVGVNFHTPGTSGPVTGRVEHLTSDTATWLNGGGTSLDLRLTNAVLVAVANPGPYSGAGNATGQATDFETVLAGGHYLAPASAHRDAGTADIDTRLAAALAGLTTGSPALWTSTITEDTVLEPWVERDSDTPDRGYHYPPLDFLLSAVAVNNATLTLTNGVAVGVYGTEGLRLQAGARFYSTGDPVNLNRLIHYRVVQEDTASANGRVGNALLRDDTAGSSSEARLRFTESVLPGGEGQHFNGGASLGWFALTDCQLLGGSFNFCYGGSYARTAGLTNNVFERVRTSLGNYSDADLVIHGRNNLFWNCPALDLTPATAQTGWEWRENCFVGCTVYQYGSVQNSNNGYLGTATLNGSSGGDQPLTASPFVSGALGPWYLDPASALINAGNRTAGAAGLFHHTTRVGQAKEGEDVNPTVDIGFHYVAVTPAGQEIPVSGGALTGSGTWYGWGYANAKNGLTTDPGWHNAGYTGTAEYLRANLGSPQPVGSVAYVPRVMAADWTGGSWNGAYRQYAIYVTDSPSNDPADWGTPVATGEWYWPNLQERKDVAFPARTGQYVYFRRIEAWGMFTRQAGQSNPGYACANEVWVHSPATPNPEAVDTDYDGLADYLEDANSDGVVQPSETDPSNAMTQAATGKLDSELAARAPELNPLSYVNSAHLHYARAASLEADFTMKWWCWRRSWAKLLGDYTSVIPAEECVLRGEDYEWPSVGEGTRTTWCESDGDRTYQPPVPCTEVLPFPGEHCTAGAYTNPTTGDVYTRSARTVTRLWGKGGPWPKAAKSVLLNVATVDKSDGSAVPWAAHQYTLAEPSMTWQGTDIDPAVSEIRVDGRLVDAHGHVLVQVPRDGHKDVTPAIADCSWYMYDLVPASPCPVRLSWSRHPSCPSVDMQALFDQAALHLAEDNDGRIKDDDPRVTPGTPQFDHALYNSDDVPTYMEFMVIKAKQSTFPPTWVFEGKPLTHSDFNNVTDPRQMTFLRLARLANIKLVNTIVLGGVPFGGQGYPGEPGIVLARKMGLPPTEIYLDWLTAIHEFGHTAGLEHRGYEDNLGDKQDATAIMHEYHCDGKEVNRFERGKLNEWAHTPPAFWNEAQP